MSEAIIEARSLSKNYKNKVALSDFSFNLNRGDILGLVGKNGAGKTTLLRLLGGLALPTHGSMSLFNEPNPARQVKLRSKMTVMVEYPALYMNLTAKENMMQRCLMEGMKGKKIQAFIKEQLDFVGLFGAHEDKRKVRSFSMGMRQRLSIAMAMVTKPEVMLLDEPTNGLDPDGIRQIRDLLLSLNRDHGVSIIISSHILGELEKLANRYLFIDEGRLLEDISAVDLEKKVGKTLTLKTSNDEEAIKLIKEHHYHFDYRDSLLVYKVKDAADVLNLLLEKGIKLLSFSETENTLEDYYLSLLGGRRHA